MVSIQATAQQDVRREREDQEFYDLLDLYVWLHKSNVFFTEYRVDIVSWLEGCFLGELATQIISRAGIKGGLPLS